jgi:murein L,D-transpeptidase YcbB/YkuD
LPISLKVSILFFCAIPSICFSSGAENIRRYLQGSGENLPNCSPEMNAINHTSEILSFTEFPSYGKFVLVNIPGGTLTAYEDGEPVIEMKAIVGKPLHPTPTQTTEITEVRFNPTWTVPSSIVISEKWMDRLYSDPDFFNRNNFDFKNKDGQNLTLEDAKSSPELIERFVQRPGLNNALGEYRFNIGSSQSIYLHDTRDRDAFHGNGPIALSHGCVRLEKPKEFAEWLLNMSSEEVDNFRAAGDTIDVELEYPVPIIMEYFTAWPDASGDIIIHEDIYQMQDNVCYSYW